MLVKSIFNGSPFGLAREMDRLFESMVAPQARGFLPARQAGWTWPAVNLWEDDDAFVAEAELPGLAMDDLEILATDDEITIKGQRNVNVPEHGRSLRQERGVGAFERTFSLPAPIDMEQVEASLRDGVLSIRLPKSAAAMPRKIEVRTT